MTMTTTQHCWNEIEASFGSLSTGRFSRGRCAACSKHWATVATALWNCPATVDDFIEAEFVRSESDDTQSENALPSSGQTSVHASCSKFTDSEISEVTAFSYSIP